MTRFLREWDLDFAYWSLNGDAWNDRRGTFTGEWYGLLKPDYASIRHPSMLRDMGLVIGSLDPPSAPSPPNHPPPPPSPQPPPGT